MISLRMRHAGIVVVVCLALSSLARVSDARTATGWAHGRKTKINLVNVSGVELEEKTAKDLLHVLVPEGLDVSEWQLEGRTLHVIEQDVQVVGIDERVLGRRVKENDGLRMMN